jgi:hypothetical protein
VVGEQLADASSVRRWRLHPRKPVLDHRVALEVLELLDLEARFGEHLLPLVLGVAAHVRRVAQPFGLFHALVDEDVVLDHDDSLRDARHFGDRLANVLEMVRGDPAGDGIEAPVLERQLFRA